MLLRNQIRKLWRMFISFRDTEATGGFVKNSFNEVIRAESKLVCLVEKELEMQTPRMHN